MIISHGLGRIQPNGKIQKRSRLFWVFGLGPKPRPGATVVVRAKGERADGSSIVQTLAVMAQTLAAVATGVAISR